MYNMGLSAIHVKQQKNYFNIWTEFDSGKGSEGISLVANPKFYIKNSDEFILLLEFYLFIIRNGIYITI